MSCRTLLAGVLALALAGCGVTPTDAIPYGAPPRPLLRGQQLYFLLNGKPFPTLRPGDTRDPVVSVDLLSAGLLPDESAAGLTTDVPANIRFFFQDQQPGILFLTADPTQLSDLGAEQITCTLAAAFAYAERPFEQLTLRDRAGHSRGPLSCRSR